ncbi:MAG: DUF4442 domain-containing protein [Bacteroidia bacterium]|jgi:hypothetical protein|nr:DUF4442 domain-containing protein [Bacteroidia bacterium]
MKNYSSFQKKATSLSMKLFLFRQLPLAFIAGVRIKTFDKEGITTNLRFRWINQNPFKSMYFAAMHMAAELATGLLLFQYMNKKNRFSMLLINTQASFTQKAIGNISFQCTEGKNAEAFVQRILASEEGDTIDLPVTAFNEKNEEIATFKYTWSCKQKRRP